VENVLSTTTSAFSVRGAVICDPLLPKHAVTQMTTAASLE
jgi:hypothetical protein